MLFAKLSKMTAAEAAPFLLGWELVRNVTGQTLRARIVETEGYHQADAASHSYNGMTPRTEVMFGPAGYAYVYFTYGMHYCFNVVVGGDGHGAAVLIRAVEPINGVEYMKKLRNKTDLLELTNGPAKLCQALSINKRLNGHNLVDKPFQLVPPLQQKPFTIVRTTRIGISRAQDELLRFYIQGNPYVSRLEKQT